MDDEQLKQYADLGKLPQSMEEFIEMRKANHPPGGEPSEPEED
jgi:hypothetical protein